MNIIDVIITVILFITMPFALTGIVAILVNRSIDAQYRRRDAAVLAERLAFAQANPRPTR